MKDINHNMLEVTGMLMSLKQALRCKVAGLGVLGIPCNSFNWMSCSQHCRSIHQPWGNYIFEWVKTGNILGSRSCLLIMALIARSCFWLTENPDRSQLANLPPLVHIMTIYDIMPLRVHWSGSQHLVHVQ